MYYAIDDFRFGLDRRKFMLNAPPGTLYELTNGHITSGGEVEKRKAFGTPTEFPVEVKWLEVIQSGFVAFGSVAEGDLTGDLPDGVTYQQLAHPNGTGTISRVVHSTVYNSAAFVIVDFGADGIVSFYDGEVVDDLSPGKLASILADAEALAEYIAGLIDALDDYEATASAGTVTVSGPDGQTFGVSASNETTCTEPLDTTPPDVTDVLVDTMLVSVDVTRTAPGTSLLQFGNTTLAISIPPTGFDDTIVDLDVQTGMGAGSLGGHTVQAIISPNTMGVEFESINFQLVVGYDGGATFTVNLTKADFTESSPGGFFAYTADIVLAADPPESTPSIDSEVVSTGSQTVTGTAPQGQLTVMAVKDGGTGKMTSITVDGTEILGTAATDLSGANYATVVLLAEAIKDQINTYCAANDVNIVAVRVDNTVVFRATDPATYSSWTGDAVVVTVDDDVCIGNCGLTFSRASEVNTPTWDAITVDGVDILGAQVTWNTDMTTSIQDVATQINSNSATYTAVAVGSTLYISKLATSSGDSPLQVVVSGTYLLYSSVGSTDGTQGGAFPGTIVVETADIPLRLQGNYPVTNSWSNSVPLVAVAVGGQPPYIYKWERSSGDSNVLLTSGEALTAPVITSPNTPRTNIQGPTKAQAKTFAAYKSGYRCQITDSMNRTGYSPEIIVHYP